VRLDFREGKQPAATCFACGSLLWRFKSGRGCHRNEAKAVEKPLARARLRLAVNRAGLAGLPAGNRARTTVPHCCELTGSLSGSARFTWPCQQALDSLVIHLPVG
jgi:hypothetical protein